MAVDEASRMKRASTLALLFMAAAAVAAFARSSPRVLPSGWRIEAPAGPVARTGTMPQGLALSPDGSQVAVVESGVDPAALRILNTSDLSERTTIPLPGAFGKPLWVDDSHVVVPAFNDEPKHRISGLLDVDVDAKTWTTANLAAGGDPTAVARSADGTQFAVSEDVDGSVTIGSGPALENAVRIAVGPHPGDVAFSNLGHTLYVAMRGSRDVLAIDTQSRQIIDRIDVGLHPSALALSADGNRLYVAVADDDAVVTVDTGANRAIARTAVGLGSGVGASPNALALASNGDLFVSLGAENAVAQLRDGKVAARIPAGWYPSGVAVSQDGTHIFVSDGKGEGDPPNPQFDPFARNSGGYVASITVGSVRRVDTDSAGAGTTARVLADAAPLWKAPSGTVVRPGGPIRHVIYVIKENRSYDQVLGDVRGANGDPRLTRFGRNVTPNLHAIALRFGVMDDAYANSQVSADGHNWTDAAFANDYVERFWPPNYGGRRAQYDFQNGSGPNVPHAGYLWDAAARARVSLRDYGEYVEYDAKTHVNATTMPGLRGRFDPNYVGWSLDVPDAARVAEWSREFRAYVGHRNLPQLEIVYLPNDHTAGTRPGSLTPQAYVALNDRATGALVDAVSHSPYWKSTAIFIVEDDAQNGPDHVSDQRSTLYLASPFARGGVIHSRYSTVSVVRTIEILLGIAPLSAYDRVARPMFDAFTSRADVRPFQLLNAGIDVRATNKITAYGASRSRRLDFSRPDAADAATMRDVLAHVRS